MGGDDCSIVGDVQKTLKKPRKKERVDTKEEKPGRALGDYNL